MLTPRFNIGDLVVTPSGFGKVVSQIGKVMGEGANRWIWWRYEIQMRGQNALILAPENAIELSPVVLGEQAARRKKAAARLNRRLQQHRAALRRERQFLQFLASAA